MSAPPYDPGHPPDRAWEASFHAACGRPGYWQRRPGDWRRRPPAA